MDLEQIRYADRSDRGKLRFAGEQAAWFLHQILTNDFEDLKPGDHTDAALLTVHGRMVGYLEALVSEDAIWVHFEPELISELPGEIERYVLATRVEIHNVTEDMGLVLVAGPSWRDVAAAAAPDALLHPTSSLGTSAGYVWTRRDQVDGLIAALEGASVTPAHEAELEDVRIANGVARWGRDMDSKTIPQEARIEDRAVHFEKGCYVGQEAMAKIHFRGKVNRKLRRLESSAALEAGAQVDLDGAKVGAVTSASGGRALALLRYTVEPGAVVTVGEVEAKVTG